MLILFLSSHFTRNTWQIVYAKSETNEQKEFDETQSTTLSKSQIVRFYTNTDLFYSDTWLMSAVFLPLERCIFWWKYIIVCYR